MNEENNWLKQSQMEPDTTIISYALCYTVVIHNYYRIAYDYTIVIYMHVNLNIVSFIIECFVVILVAFSILNFFRKLMLFLTFLSCAYLLHTYQTGTA